MSEIIHTERREISCGSSEERANQALARFEERRHVQKASEPSEDQSLLTTISRIAADPNADIEKLTKVMDLYERVKSGRAKAAFDTAIAEAKAEIPPITRNAKGHNDKKYADFAAIARVVDPVLARHGLSYRFRTEQTDRINVTCILSHKEGHSETTTLAGTPDTSGSKNAIQAIGSTLTYLQRYSLVQSLGLAAADDDDGRLSEGDKTISPEQITQLQELLIETSSDPEKFLAFVRLDRLDDMLASKFAEAVAIIKRKARRPQ